MPAWLVIVLHVVVAVLALATAVVLGAPAGWVVAVLVAAACPLGGAVLGLVAALPGGHRLAGAGLGDPGRRHGLLAVAWLGALSASGSTRSAR